MIFSSLSSSKFFYDKSLEKLTHWLSEIGDAPHISNRVKVMLVGSAKAGKTSLRTYLTSNKPPKGFNVATDGIEIEDTIVHHEDLDVVCDLWDFGGSLSSILSCF